MSKVKKCLMCKAEPDDDSNYCLYHRRYYQRYNSYMRAKEFGLTEHFTVQEWCEIVRLADNKCAICKGSAFLCVDHNIPLTKGGSNRVDNIQAVCFSCNSSKSNSFRDKQRGSNPSIIFKPGGHRFDTVIEYCRKAKISRTEFLRVAVDHYLNSFPQSGEDTQGVQVSARIEPLLFDRIEDTRRRRSWAEVIRQGLKLVIETKQD